MEMTISFRRTTLQLATLLLAALAGSGPAFATDVRFNRDIRPILSNNCFACHGPDEKKRKGGLRLDTFEGATAPRKNKKPGIVPGKPDQSEVIVRVHTDDEDDQMPPPEIGRAHV